jgi:hypothetical protein
MAAKTVCLRYPFTGDRYCAEGRDRIRVEHGERWGYFNASGRWLEGTLRAADPCFCRFLSSSWLMEQSPEEWGLIPQKMRQ